MSTYTTSDLEYSLEKCLGKAQVKCVVAAWGNVDRDGACCDACGGEWSGGFLLELKDGQYAYVTGWCDYTGWGCRDGAEVSLYETKPALSEIENIPVDKWDLDPIDLNRWLEQP
jgi:hypothetical protein